MHPMFIELYDAGSNAGENSIYEWSAWTGVWTGIQIYTGTPVGNQMLFLWRLTSENFVIWCDLYLANTIM